MSPVGTHTHVCVECSEAVECDGGCPNDPRCEICASYQQAVTANDIAATKDQDVSRHERFARGTPIGEVERRAFDRDMRGDEG